MGLVVGMQSLKPDCDLSGAENLTYKEKKLTQVITLNSVGFFVV